MDVLLSENVDIDFHIVDIEVIDIFQKEMIVRGVRDKDAFKVEVTDSAGSRPPLTSLSVRSFTN